MITVIGSIYGNWKVAFAYQSINKKMTTEDFKRIFTTKVEAILSTGLKVRVIITDGLQKNKAAFFMMGSSED
jgi:hypothetical protein